MMKVISSCNLQRTTKRVCCHRLIATLFAQSRPKATSVLEKHSQEDDVKPFSDIPGPRPSVPIIGTSWQYWKYGKFKLVHALFAVKVNCFFSYVTLKCVKRALPPLAANQKEGKRLSSFL